MGKNNRINPRALLAAFKAYAEGEPPTSIAIRLGVTLHAFRYQARKIGIWVNGQKGKPIFRFWQKVKKTESCWIWTAGAFSNGYGCFAINGEAVLAHRYSYELYKGKIPEGLYIDHLCRNRLCVNPEHLEPVTNAENVRRGMVLKGKKYVLKTTN